MRLASLVRSGGKLTVAVVITALVLSCIYLWVTPPLAAPDEGAHLAYPRHVLIEHELPTYTRASDDWENHQPPLYYLLSMPFVAAGQSMPILRQVVFDRTLSVVLYVVTAWLLLVVLREILPKRTEAHVVGLLVLSLPMVVNAGATFNNDMLGCTTIVSLWWLGWRYREQQTTRRLLLVGFGLGLVALSKVVAYPAGLVVMTWALWRRPWRSWLIVVMVAGAVSGWWFVQNLVRVGDVLGLKYTSIFWSGQHVSVWSWHGLMLLGGKLAVSFIGVLGKSDIFLPWVWYGIAWALIGWLGWRLYRIRSSVSTYWLIIGGMVATVAGVIALNNRFFQPQGRYLLPLVPFLVVACAEVVARYRIQRWTWIVVGLVFCGINLNAVQRVYDEAKNHPSPLIQYPRTIDLLSAMRADNPRQSTLTNSALVIQPGARFFLPGSYTDTTRHPLITLTTASGEAYTVRVEWRVPGQAWFDDRRVQSITSTDTVTKVTFLEHLPTAIESIRLTFSSNGPVSLIGAALTAE